MDPAYKVQVHAFLASRRIAVVGYSSQSQAVANVIYQKLKKHGYEPIAINHRPETVTDVPCYARLTDLSEPPEAVMICTPPTASFAVLEQAQLLGIRHVWVHRSIGEGSYDPSMADFALKHHLNLITGGCPMMFIEPDVFHRCLRWWVNRQGKLAVSSDQ